MKVVIQTIVPSPYRVLFFIELGKLCDLTVIYEGKRPDNGRVYNWLSIKLSYKEIFLEETYNEKKVKWNILKYFLSNNFDIRVVSCYHTYTGMMLISALKIFRKKYFFEIDGAIINKNEATIKRYIKHFLIHGAYKYFSPSCSTDQYFKYYAQVQDSDIIRYSFTSVSQKDILQNCLSEEEKNKLRKSLNIKHKKVIVSVGQFIYRKGYDILLNSLSKCDKDTGVYIIGGKVTNEYITLCKKYNLANVHFLEFMEKAELDKYYKAADLFVLPTREDIWGLVINEAMAYGLPIITTDKCVAGVQLLNNQELTIIPTNDISSLATAINYLLKDDQKRMEIAKYNLNEIKKHSIEDMAQEHFIAFKK